MGISYGEQLGTALGGDSSRVTVTAKVGIVFVGVHEELSAIVIAVFCIYTGDSNGYTKLFQDLCPTSKSLLSSFWLLWPSRPTGAYTHRQGSNGANDDVMIDKLIVKHPMSQMACSA